MKKFKKRFGLRTSAQTNFAAQVSMELPHIFSCYEKFSGLNKQEYLDAAQESPLVLNLYMLIEGLMNYQDSLTSEMVHEMEFIRRKRGWKRISPDFLESWSPTLEGYAHVIKESSTDLRSKEESVRRVGKIVGPGNIISTTSTCTIRALFCTTQTFAFHFKHPTTNSCHQPGKCGFVLKCTPDMTSGLPCKFKVNLCLNQKEYPEGIHIHPEFVRADKIHLVPMMNYGGQLKFRYCLRTFTWNEFGVSDIHPRGATEIWKIGTMWTEPGNDMKLIAFLTL